MEETQEHRCSDTRGKHRTRVTTFPENVGEMYGMCYQEESTQ